MKKVFFSDITMYGYVFKIVIFVPVLWTNNNISPKIKIKILFICTVVQKSLTNIVSGL